MTRGRRRLHRVPTADAVGMRVTELAGWLAGLPAGTGSGVGGEELLAERVREPVDEPVVGPAAVDDQGTVGRGAAQGEQDIHGIGRIQAGAEPEPASQVRDDAGVPVAAQLLVACPDLGRVGFVGRGARDVVQHGDPGRDRREALGEAPDRGEPVAGVEHRGVPRLGGRGPGVILAQHSQLIAGLQELGLGVEGEVHGLHGDPGFRGDVGHPSPGVPAAGEDPLCGADHPQPGRAGPVTPAGAGAADIGHGSHEY
jgi:hypothetical protein